MAGPENDNHVRRVMRYALVEWLELQHGQYGHVGKCIVQKIVRFEDRHYLLELRTSRIYFLDKLTVRWLPFLDDQFPQPITTALIRRTLGNNESGLHRGVWRISTNYEYLISLEVRRT